MLLREILIPDAVLLDLEMKSFGQALDHVSGLAAEITGIRAPVIAEALHARHAQGTLVNKGTAVPHARVGGLVAPVAFFLRLRTPLLVNENEPVDMLFILLAPTQADGQHLRALAEVARLMRDDDFSIHLRNATSRQELWNLLISE